MSFIQKFAVMGYVRACGCQGCRTYYDQAWNIPWALWQCRQFGVSHLCTSGMFLTGRARAGQA